MQGLLLGRTTSMHSSWRGYRRVVNINITNSIIFDPVSLKQGNQDVSFVPIQILIV